MVRELQNFSSIEVSYKSRSLGNGVACLATFEDMEIDGTVITKDEIIGGIFGMVPKSRARIFHVTCVNQVRRAYALIRIRLDPSHNLPNYLVFVTKSATLVMAHPQ